MTKEEEREDAVDVGLMLVDSLFRGPLEHVADGTKVGCTVMGEDLTWTTITTAELAMLGRMMRAAIADGRKWHESELAALKAAGWPTPRLTR